VRLKLLFGLLTGRYERGSVLVTTNLDFEPGCLTVPEELASTQTDARVVLDRSILVYGWLNRNAGNCRFAFSDSTPFPSQRGLSHERAQNSAEQVSAS
jgi:hypothetical protein